MTIDLLVQVLFQMDLKNFEVKICVYFARDGIMTKHISKVPSTWQFCKKKGRGVLGKRKGKIFIILAL